MKKTIIFLAMLLLVGIGYGAHHYFNNFGREQATSLISGKFSPYKIQQELQTFYPVVENQSIAIIVLAENDRNECERNLHSILDQNYTNFRLFFIDNGSDDGTLEYAKAIVEKKKASIPIKWIRFEEKQPKMEIIYEVIHECDAREVVTILKGKDWLAHENVLDHLNCAYANPEVWITYSKAINYPEYQKVEGEIFPDSFFLEKKFRENGNSFITSVKSFYAALFKAIKLEDILFQGKFIDDKIELALFLPMMEMSPKHVLFMDEITSVQNLLSRSPQHKSELQRLKQIDSHIRLRPKYSSLSSLRLQDNQNGLQRMKGDIVIFSEDTPLHLYACLESLISKICDTGEISVIYKASDSEFERAYLNLQGEFPNLAFYDVCDYQENEFKTLFSKVVMNKRYTSPFLLLTDDQIIFDEKIKFHDCIQAMEKVHVNQFFLSFDEKKEDSVEPLPQAILINKGIYGWQMGEDGVDLPLFAQICRKENLQEITMEEQLEDFSSLKQFLKDQLSPETVALFFEEKKTWGHQFIEGFKIDLPSLLCDADEYKEGDYPLIKREKRVRTHMN